MLCENCKEKLPTVFKRQLRVNSELYQLGLEYNTLGHFLYTTDRVLVKHGFNEMQTFIQPGPTGHVHQEVGDGKWLSLSWYKMPSGRFEFVAYVN